MKRLLIILLLIIPGRLSFGQQVRLIENGRIEFTKIVNVYAIAKKMQLPEDLYERYKNTHSQFFESKSVLHFTDNQTAFIPEISANVNPMNVYNNIPFPFADQRNLIFVDWLTSRSTTEKMLFGEKYLVKDSTRKISWKITDEFREIAGFTCRRANAILLDSIYVVAFYTNDIHISGGPESFGGLPGMILEVALPHENVRWRAVSVTESKVSKDKMTPPDQGKKIDNKQLNDVVKSTVKGFGHKVSDLLLKDLLI